MHSILQGLCTTLLGGWPVSICTICIWSVLIPLDVDWASTVFPGTTRYSDIQQYIAQHIVFVCNLIKTAVQDYFRLVLVNAVLRVFRNWRKLEVLWMDALKAIFPPVSADTNTKMHLIMAQIQVQKTWQTCAGYVHFTFYTHYNAHGVKRHYMLNWKTSSHLPFGVLWTWNLQLQYRW